MNLYSILRKIFLRFGVFVGIVGMPGLSALAAPGQITVHLDQPGVRTSPQLYDLMTEEINHSYDGGLYGELIQNRALKDDAQQPVHWSAVTSGDAAVSLALDQEAPAGTMLTNSLRVVVTRANAGNPAGVANDGYWGIPIKSKTTYRASFYARAAADFHGPLMLRLESSDGAHIAAHAQVGGLTTSWRKFTAVLVTGLETPAPEGRFVIAAAAPATFWLTQVSLFPPTYHNRTNGTRIDLMQKMAALHPALLRFPGGNYLEGDTIATRFDWKKTIGPMEQRPGHRGPWGYRSSDGFGMPEFLGWCEDLHMQPLLAVYAGYSLRGYQKPNPEIVPSGPALAPYVQDALDEIEYVAGGPKTKWGARRVQDGYPKPLTLEYVEIGNEDWFDKSGSYDGRFAQFYDAIKARYPHLKLIATTHITSRRPDLYDEHYYRSPRDMENNASQYDGYDRNGPKVFVGEWASQEGKPTPDMNSALGDAAWLTGLERNADVVPISAYAPLLVNVNPGAAQWGVNLIGYDALSSFGSPSYYVQEMFGADRGDVVLPVDLAFAPPSQVGDPHPTGGVGVGTWGTQAEFRNIQVTHAGTALYTTDFVKGDADWHFGDGTWKVADGVLQQTSDMTNCRAMVGDPQWTDYTLSLEARKTGGREGFLILFHTHDQSNWVWWNIGGWNNSRSGLERSFDGNNVALGASAPLTVEAGRWYSVKIEVEGPQIRCYIDGKLITEATDAPPAPPPSVYAVATRDLQKGDIILKVVNVAAEPQETTITLAGAKPMQNGKGRYAVAENVLAGAPEAVNTLSAPKNVFPAHDHYTIAQSAFHHVFPAHSVTVLRVTDTSP